LALALVLAGAAAQAADQPVLHIGDQRGMIQLLLKASGQLDNVPYRLDWAIFPVGAPLVEAMNGGSVDFGYVGDATTTFGLAAGAPIKTISVWRFNGAGAAIVVPETSPAHSIADLRGHRIGLVRGSPGHLLVAAALKQANIPISAVSLAYLSAVDAKSALDAGSIDAWSIWDPYIAEAELHGHARILLTAQGVIEEIECGIASEQAIATKRAQLLDFLERVRRGFEWADTHVEERAKLFSEETSMPLDVMLRTYGRMHVVLADQIDDEAIALHQNVADLYYEVGIIRAKLDIRQAYDRSFVLPPE
jgi:sulfonate transport system substrate-binding protein